MEGFYSVDKLPLACRFQETVESRFTKLCGVQYLAGFFFFFFFIANCLNGLHVCKSGHKLVYCSELQSCRHSIFGGSELNAATFVICFKTWIAHLFSRTLVFIVV